MDNEVKAKFQKNFPKFLHWIKSKVSKISSLKLCIELQAKFLKKFLKMGIEIKAKFLKKFPFDFASN